jgi:hypothetical protein
MLSVMVAWKSFQRAKSLAISSMYCSGRQAGREEHHEADATASILTSALVGWVALWMTFATGVSRVNCGGVTESQPTMFRSRDNRQWTAMQPIATSVAGMPLSY